MRWMHLSTGGKITERMPNLPRARSAAESEGVGWWWESRRTGRLGLVTEGRRRGKRFFWVPVKVCQKIRWKTIDLP